MARIGLLLSLPFFLQGIVAEEQRCFGVDGTLLDASYSPCNPDARHSGCCATNRAGSSPDICLDSGLCMATSGRFVGTLWQTGCTDPSGQDSSCPQLCPDGKDDSLGLDEVTAWNIQICDFGKYCCRKAGDTNNCCNNEAAPRFETDSLGSLQLPASTVRISSTVTGPEVTSIPQCTSLSPTSVVGTAASTGEPLSQSTASAVPVQACKPDRSGIVGGVLGGVLAVVLLGLGAVIWWIYKKEKRQRRLKEHYEEQFGQNFAYRRTIVVESDSRIALDSPYSEKEFVHEESSSHGGSG